MAHFSFRWLVLAVAAMVVVVALLMQSHGWSDSGRSAAERGGERLRLARHARQRLGMVRRLV